MFIPPMLASPVPKDFKIKPGEWSADEKFDGHRLIMCVSNGQTNLFTSKKIVAWSRLGLQRPLPTHILEATSRFPICTLDGELLVPGKRSYGVTELANTADLVYCVFDVLEIGGEPVTEGTYDNRQAFLRSMFKNLDSYTSPIRLAPATPVDTWEEVTALRDKVWSRDGEGLILKRRSAPYTPGKRTKDFLKIKALRSAVLTVTALHPSRGTKVDRGPYAMVELLDDEGNTTTVKTKNDTACREFEGQAIVGERHPAIGRLLRIDYQERTNEGNYRHPRWDRWEDE